MTTCVAIDDEPIALDILREYCRRHGGLQLECFTSPLEGMRHIAATRPDIVFLDIEMNSSNGLALAHELPEDTCLIFTTAYSQYALEGFEVNAVDFLHKPIFYPRFEQAMEKALKWNRLRLLPAQGAHDAITLKVEHKNVVIRVDEISYIEAMDNYIKVYRDNLPMVLSQITMKEMERMLPDDRFIRVHRSYIVSLPHIESFSNRRIRLREGGKEIPVGRKYTDSFNNLYKIFTLKK
jgi:two-component system response regulator protein